uniref:NADH-ubiquinone oxidoreductase chain 1 n=1 Tax=Monomachus antipodalis TaxID=161211 RepID=A0A0E3IC90_9HYME|nr:NADH dehydrogenase subunit 1 [Monomachus antipodalis]
MFNYNLNLLIYLLMNIIMILLSVAFVTLLERKILGYIQIRKGPNKISFLGILQPFSDAIKLFSNENLFILKSNYYLYYMSPMLMLLIMLMMWMIIPNIFNIFSFNLSIMFMLCLMNLSVYTTMMSGWSSNSLYSFLGCIRSIAQTISYEVSMILILMLVMLLTESLTFFNFMNYQKFCWFIFLMPLMAYIFFINLLAEMNRTPFDLSEGESELVSGFNIEYMSGSFAFIFLTEYGMIIFMMYMYNMMFLSSNNFYMTFFFKLSILIILIIWIRGSFPRIRYDKLMNLIWKKFLPISLNFMFIIVSMKMFVYLT